MLQKPEVHVENILKVAEFIENLPTQNETTVFDYNRWGRTPIKAFSMRHVYAEADCGTVACIAGVCGAMWPGVCADESLGLNTVQGRQLFMPKGYSDSDVTSKQAARVLRHLAITGEVDWKV